MLRIALQIELLEKHLLHVFVCSGELYVIDDAVVGVRLVHCTHLTLLPRLPPILHGIQVLLHYLVRWGGGQVYY